MAEFPGLPLPKRLGREATPVHCHQRGRAANRSGFVSWCSGERIWLGEPARPTQVDKYSRDAMSLSQYAYGKIKIRVMKLNRLS